MYPSIGPRDITIIALKTFRVHPYLDTRPLSCRDQNMSTIVVYFQMIVEYWCMTCYWKILLAHLAFSVLFPNTECHEALIGETSPNTSVYDLKFDFKFGINLWQQPESYRGTARTPAELSVSPKHFLLVLGVRALNIFNHRKERKEKKTVKLENTSSKLTRATRSLQQV